MTSHASALSSEGSLSARALHALGLREGEGPRALRLLGLIFTMSAALVLLKAAQSGIFLVAYPRSTIPWAFAASALTLAAASMALVPLAARLGPSRLAALVFVSGAFVVLGMRVAMALRVPHAKFALYVVIEALSGVLLIQTWSVVSEASNARSAKRLLPIAGIGASAAWTLGGLLVPGLVAWFGASSLLVAAPALLFVCLGLVVAVRRSDLGDAVERGSKRASLASEWRAGFDFVRRVPLMRVGVVLSVLALITEQLMDFQFMSAARERYAEPGACSSFFGTYYGVTSAVAMVLLLTLSGRFLSEMGASRALLVTPALTACVGLLAFVLPVFPLVVALRASDRVLKQSTWSSAMEQTQMPLPVVRRAQARALVRGVIGPLGYALAAVCLAALPEHTDARWLALVTAGLTAAMAVVVARFVRRAYQGALRRAIEGRRLPGGDAPPLDVDACKALTIALRSTDEAEAALAAEVLGTTRLPMAVGALRAAVLHPAPAVRLAAVEGLSHLGAAGALDGLADLVEGEPDPLVRRAAIVALSRLGAKGHRAERALEAAAGADEAEVRSLAAAVLRLARGESAARLLEDDALAEDTTRLLLPGHVDDADVVGALGRLLVGERSLSLRLAVVAAAGRLGVCGDGLEAVAADPNVGSAACVELVRREHPAVLRLLSHRAASVRERASEALAGAIRQRATWRSPSGATEPALDHELRHAYLLVSVLAGLSRDDGKPDWEFEPEFRFLAGEVERALVASRTRALRLLALFGKADLVRTIEDGTSRGSAVKDAQIAELLELSLPSGVADKLVPLFEQLSLRERVAAAKRAGLLREDAASDPLPVLLELDDEHLVGCAAATYKERFRKRYPDRYDALAPLIPLFERISFLRSTALFSGLGGEDLRSLAERLREVSYEPGALIFHKGDLGDELFLVTEGRVLVRDGALELARIGSREVFGELSVLDREPRSADVLAEEATTLLSLSRGDLADIMVKRPKIREEILLVVVRRLRGLTERVALQPKGPRA